jgi:acyl dehydratase
LVDNLLDGDVSGLRSYGARMAGVVFPGETLRVTAWKTDDKFNAVVTAPERDNAVALAGVEFVPA